MSLRTRILIAVSCVMVGVLALLTVNLAADALARVSRERVRQGELVAAWVQDWVLDQQGRLAPLAADRLWPEMGRHLSASSLVVDWVIVEPDGERYAVAASCRPRGDEAEAGWSECLEQALRRNRVWVSPPWVATPLVLPGARTIGVAMAVPTIGESAPDLVQTLARMAWVMFLGTALLLLVMGILLNRLVLRPMGALVEGAKRAAQGDFSRPVPEPGSYDEMTELMRAFNGMMGRLAEHQQVMEADIASARDRLSTAERKLVVAQRLSSVGTLAAGVAHEINNPLGGLINATRALQGRCGGDDRAREYTALILDGLERIQETVRKLLHFGPRRLTRQPFALADAVERALALCDHRFQERGVLVESRVGRDLPLLHGDPGEIQQAVLNVVMNAADAVAPGAGLIRLAAQADGDQILLTIADNGRGMDAATLRRAAEPFYTTKEAGAGTGLGLAVVQSILERHGGTLGLSSAAGRGTEVTLVLPLDRTAPGRPDGASQA